MTKDTNFKFGMVAPRESSDVTLKNFFEKGAWPGSRDPLNFWALKWLNANSSKMNKGTNFKFGIFVPTESPVMTPEKKFFEKGAWPGSRDPVNFKC